MQAAELKQAAVTRDSGATAETEGGKGASTPPRALVCPRLTTWLTARDGSPWTRGPAHDREPSVCIMQFACLVYKVTMALTDLIFRQSTSSFAEASLSSAPSL